VPPIPVGPFAQLQRFVDVRGGELVGQLGL
jgi:hypothetical protein